MTTPTPTARIPLFVKILFSFLVFIILMSLYASLKKPRTADQVVADNPPPSPTKTIVSAVQPVSTPKPEPKITVSNITFHEFHRIFAYDSGLTDLQKDEEWKQYRGLCIEWTGELVHLDQGVFGGISIGMKHLGATLTYDVLIDAPSSQKDVLLSWRQGSRHTYRATLTGYGGPLLPISADWGCEKQAR